MEFDFNKWLNDNNLTEYAQIFNDHCMNTQQCLNFHNPNYIKLMADERIRTNPDILTKVIQSIQILQQTENDDHNHNQIEMTNKGDRNNNDNLSEHTFYIISNEENEVLENLNQNLNDLTQLKKYIFSIKDKYEIISKRNEEKQLNYIQELNKMKQEIINIFDKLYNKLKQRENNLLNKISKHENYIKQQEENTKNEIELKLKENENIILNHESYLKSQILKYKIIIKKYHNQNNRIERKEKILDISSDVNNENIKLMKIYNLNKIEIEKYLNENNIRIRGKIYIQFNDNNVFKYISNIANIIKYDDDMTVEIKSADLLNDNTLKLSFDTKNKYDNYLIRQYDVLYYFTKNNELEIIDKNKKGNEIDIEWKKPHKINMTKNNNVLITFKSNESEHKSEIFDDNDDNDNNNMKRYLYIKVRIQNSLNIWSSFSSVCKMQIETIENMIPNINPIFYLSQDLKTNPDGIYLADLDHITQKTEDVCKDKKDKNNNYNWKCQIHQLSIDGEENNKILTQDKTKWIIKNSGIYYKKNMGHIIPTIIKDNIFKIDDDEEKYMLSDKSDKSSSSKSSGNRSRKLNDMNDYDIIFKCGGYKSQYCSAIIIDKNQLNDDNNNDYINLYNWNLPNFKTNIDGNSLIYNNYHLFSIGGIEKRYGYSDKIYCLSFHQNHQILNKTQWKWQNIVNMQAKRCWSSPIMVKRSNSNYNYIDNNNNNNKSLIVIGGRNHWGSQTIVEIFNFNKSKWNYLQSCNYARYKAGIYYDKLINNLYLAGGHNAEKKIEVYDIIKNKWRNLPDTNIKHENYPIIWKTNCILYITSTDSNSIEYIDLRTNKTNNISWNTNSSILLQNIFNTQFVDKTYCRLCK